MPIIAINEQPGSAIAPKIVSAYRPVVFRVEATRTDAGRIPPVVYCDIYINGYFYKTLSSTQYESLKTNSTVFFFDISDAAQEYLSAQLPTNGISTIEYIPKPVITVFARFRSSGFDTEGFLVPEDAVPVQGTGTKPPTSGTGTLSENFYILNATLQHEDNQDLQAHLGYAKPAGTWDAAMLPVTHRRDNYRICKDDSDAFPFIYLGGNPFLKICITYKKKSDGSTVTSCYNIPQACASVVSNIVAVVGDDNNVSVTFDSSGTATAWEWTIDGGAHWHVIYTKSFSLSWVELLIALITEAGEPILTEDGEIIIPETVDPYALYNLDIRPRCSNGIYGTTGSGTFTIDPPVTCDPPSLFSYNSQDYGADTISFNITLPGAETDFQLEWKFDYGGGFVGPAFIEYGVLAGPVFVWNIPAGYNNGSFIVRIRTKCTDTDFSQWSAPLPVAWDDVMPEINVTVDSIVNIFSTQYRVTVSLDHVSTSDITVNGWFVADKAGGGTGTFMYSVFIPNGTFSATGDVSGGAAGGSVVYNGAITSATPDPTADGYDLVYH